MSKFTIAAAQSSSIRGDLQSNIEEHIEFTKIAAEYEVDVIVFPELSLTGYEPDLAHKLALNIDDDILNPLVDISNKLRIAIIAGCPIRFDSAMPFIGSFIIQPGKPISVYRKRYLHTGEEHYFKSSQDNVIFYYKEEFIGVAICADINNTKHPADAKKDGATIYSASVCMTVADIDKAYGNMSRYCIQHHMLAVMANHATNTGGYTTAGMSAIWDSTGQLLANVEGSGRVLVLVCKHDDGRTGKTIMI